VKYAKILGVDFGTKIIGLAVAEEDLVEPLAVIEFSGWEEKLKKLCQQQEIDKIVVGVSEGKSAILAKKFGQKLAKITGLPVEFADETLTTHDALVRMKTVTKKWRDKLDAVAAALILENYLNV